MKKMIAFITTLFILLSPTVSAFAADGLPYVVDHSGLLSEDEVAILEHTLQERSESLNFDIVVLTVDSLEGKTAEAYADDYYDDTGYGYGENHDGCLLLVAMDEREWHLSTTGYGITVLTDAGIDYISQQFLGDLSSGNYYQAFTTYINLVDDFVQQADNGESYDYYNLDEYDSNYNEYYTDNDSSEGSISVAIIVGIIAGGIITFVFISILKRKMKTVYHKAQANDYFVKDSLKITGAHDIFITSHVTKTAKESKSSGGSSTHSSSSGTSHGGGGGHF